MIEVDLRPGREKEPSGGGGLGDVELEMPDWASLEGLRTDPWTAAVVIAGLVLAGGIAWSWMSQERRAEELDRRLERAVQDSARLTDLRTLSDSLIARRKSIRSRVRLVKELDRNRYVWPHLLVEVSRALPGVAWIVSMERTSSLPGLDLVIRGVAANPLAITSFVRNLREQPHVGSATIQGSSRQQVEGVTAQSFTLRLSYRRPPEAQVRTRPLVASGGG